MANPIVNLTLFLVLMNLAGSVITETGTFEVRRSDMTEAECTAYSGSWLAGRGGNGFCTLSSIMEVQYENNLDNAIREAVCINPGEEALGEECTPRNFADEGVSNSRIDTALKTFGDLSWGLGVTADIISAAVISPFSWIGNMAFQCSTIADVNSHCTAQEVQDAQRWANIVSLFQIPVYLVYALFMVQLIINRRIL
jgi:hypothetical protein